MIAVAPVAGWYRDPSDAASMRWWSGAGWTGHVQPLAPTPRPRSTVTSASVAPAAPATTSSNADSRWTSNYTDDELQLYTSRTKSRATTETVRHSELTADGRTLLSFERSDALGTDLSIPVPNGSAWAVASIPILAFLIAAALAGLQVVGAVPSSFPVTALSLPLLIVQLLLVVRDWRGLRNAGLPAANSAWALINPVVYLARRAVVLRGRPGVAGPLVLLSVLTALQLAAVGAVYAIVGLAAFMPATPASAPSAASSPTTAHVVERTIERDLAAKGQNWKVDCSTATIAVAPNTSFQCTASMADGHRGVVAVITDAQGTQSYSLTASN